MLLQHFVDYRRLVWHHRGSAPEDKTKPILGKGSWMRNNYSVMSAIRAREEIGKKTGRECVGIQYMVQTKTNSYLSSPFRPFLYKPTPQSKRLMGDRQVMIPGKSNHEARVWFRCNDSSRFGSWWEINKNRVWYSK